MKSVVAVAKGEDIYRLVEDALKLSGADTLIEPHYRVFIKPNFVAVPSNSPYIDAEGSYAKWVGPEGFITRREVLEALIRILKGWGVEDITVGEASGGCQTPLVYKALDIYGLAEEYGFKLIDLNYAKAVKVPVPNKLFLESFWLPKIIQESDFLIDLTTIKVHGRTAVSFCLKNWGIGILPGKYYGFDKSGSHVEGIEEPLPIHKRGEAMILGQEVIASKIIADVCSAKPPHLGIIDGITAVHNAKLTDKIFGGMKVERLGLMIAGRDIVAVDSVTSRIVGIDPGKVLHIKWSSEKGLGTLDLSRIEVKGVSIEEVQIRCNPLRSQTEIML